MLLLSRAIKLILLLSIGISHHLISFDACNNISSECPESINKILSDGNNCSDAIVLNPGPSSLNNCCPTGAGVWYEVPSEQDGITLSFTNGTIGSSLVVELYDSCGGTLLGTYSGNFTESYSNCGRNYFIRVHSTLTDCGDFTIEYNYESCGTVMFDDCSTSLPITTLSLGSPGCFSGCLQYSCTGECGNSNGTWYAIDFSTVGSNMIVEVQAPSDFDPLISVYIGDCNTAEVVCENTNITDVAVNSGSVYYIEISSLGVPGNFDVCFTLQDIPVTCSVWNELTITRPENPTLNSNGPFNPGETVNFCFALDFEVNGAVPPNGNGCQWLQGVIPTVGDGWDLNATPLSNQSINASFTNWYDDVLYSPHAETTNPVLSLVTSPNNSNGIGIDYVPEGGSLSGGDLLPGGWYATTATGGDPCNGGTHPNGSWGINTDVGCNGNQVFDICFDLTVKDFSTRQECSTADLSVALFAMADGMTGCWQNSSCAQDQPAFYNSGRVDCDQIQMIPCLDTIENILCSTWLQDSIAQIECPIGIDCRVDVFGLAENPTDGIEYIFIDISSSLVTDYGFGFIYDCGGQQVGTSMTTIGGVEFEPAFFTDYALIYISSLTLGEEICPEEDNDGDGFPSSSDCDDNNPNVNPDAIEVCNNIDDNCDGSIDEGFTVFRYFYDGDGDGYGRADSSVVTCFRPTNFVENSDDCDDNNPNVNPAASEIIYNGIDDDCNSATRDDDLDEDGFIRANDCDDNNAAINPSAPELCDGLDNNCNSQIDEGITYTTYYQDADGDGFGNIAVTIDDCKQVMGYVTNSSDCDDSNTDINPSAPEVCDGLDNNCNTQADEGLAFSTYYQDADGDGYGNNMVTIMDCKQVIGYVINSEDCDDNDPEINPAVDEICDGQDNNCNSDIDEGLAVNTYYEDWDEDGYGNLDISIDDCRQVIGYVLNGEDCNDSIPEINPVAIEIPNNGIDENCDGVDLLDAIHEFTDGQVSIYPNPVSETLHLSVEGSLSYQVRLYNLDGKLILTSDNPSLLQLNQLSNGTYILMLEESDTNRFILERIVILK